MWGYHSELYRPYDLSVNRYGLLSHQFSSTRNISNIIPQIKTEQQTQMINLKDGKQKQLLKHFHNQQTSCQHNGSIQYPHSNAHYAKSSQGSLSQFKEVKTQDTTPSNPRLLSEKTSILQSDGRLLFEEGLRSITQKSSQSNCSYLSPCLRVKSQDQPQLQQAKVQDENQQQFIIYLTDQQIKGLQDYNPEIPTTGQIFKIIQTISKALPNRTIQKSLCSIHSYLQKHNHQNEQQIITNKPPISLQNCQQNRTPVSAPQHNLNPYQYSNRKELNQQTLVSSISPECLNQNHPSYLPSSHVYETQRYVRRHRLKREVLGMSDPYQNSAYRQNLQRKVAYVFVLKGYGLGMTRQILDEQIQNNLYNSSLTSVVRIATRKMVDVMRNSLGLRVEGFDSREQIRLRSPLANCRKWMQEKDLATMFKIIARIYNLNDHPEDIYPYELISLYNTVCRQINKKTISINKIENKPVDMGLCHHSCHSNSLQYFQHPQRKPLPQFKQPIADFAKHTVSARVATAPTPPKTRQVFEFQRQLLDMYSKYGNIDRINQLLNLKYKFSNTVEQSKETLQKLMRLGLKNLLFNYAHCKKKEQNLPELKLNSAIVEFMINDREDSKFKMTLVRLMVEVKFNNRDKVLNLVKFINQYVQSRGLSSAYLPNQHLE